MTINEVRPLVKTIHKPSRLKAVCYIGCVAMYSDATYGLTRQWRMKWHTPRVTQVFVQIRTIYPLKDRNVLYTWCTETMQIESERFYAQKNKH